MRWNKLIVLLTGFTMTGCGALKAGFDNAITTAMSSVIPDACDLKLIGNIAAYRKESSQFPADVRSLPWTDSSSMSCKVSFDSISLTPFGKDSAELFVRKKPVDKRVMGVSFSKYYGIKFTSDSSIVLSSHTASSKK